MTVADHAEVAVCRKRRRVVEWATRSQDAIHGGLWLIGARALVAAMGWTCTIIVARRLDGTDFGQFSLVFAILTVVGTLSDLQVSRVVLHDLSQGDQTAAPSYLMFRLAVSVVSFVASVGVALILYGSDLALATGIAAFALVFTGAANGLHIYLQHRLAMRPIAIGIAAGQALQLLCTVGLALAGANRVIAFVLPAVANELFHLVLLLFLLRGTFPRRVLVEWSRWTAWMREAFLLAVGIALTAVQLRVGMLLLSKLEPLDDVGQYAVAAKFAELLSFVPAALLAPVLTVLVRNWPSNHLGFRIAFRKVLGLLSLLGILVVTAFAVCGESIIELAYGEQFSPAVVPAQLLVLAQAIRFVTMCYVMAFLSTGRNRVYVLAAAASFVVNALMCLVLIPFWQGTGAAVALVISEVVAVTVTGFAIWQSDLRLDPLPRAIAGGLLAGALGFGAGWASMQAVPWPLATVVACAVFAGACRVFGLVPAGFRNLLRLDV